MGDEDALSLPCDLPPQLPCCHAGRCFGRVTWEGKSGPSVPLEQVQACQWHKRATEVRERMARENESKAGDGRRNDNPAA